jgi:hypothetical protein
MKKDAGTTDGGPVDVAVADVADGDAGGSDVGIGDAGGGNPDSATNDSGVPPEPLCDGTQHLRLWVFIAPRDEVRGSMVRVENGRPFLAIDGTCSYWIGGGWASSANDALGSDRPIRTGKLTQTDAASVEQTAPLGDIARLGDCGPPPAGLYDYSFRVIRTAVAYASCFTSAPELTAGTRFEAAWMTLETIANTLWNDGTPVTGALHVSAVNAPDGPSKTAAYAWPLAAPLGSFVLSDGDSNKVGVSHLVDDPTSASQLRALRDQYLADRTAQPGLYVNWDGLEVTDQTSTRLIYMRDATPYEDAQGLLTF